MKIILAEVTSGKNSSELAFDKGSVLIGRDASVCDIVFDGATFPMVSRRHAELAWAGGSWTIRDLGSSYGTYVDGRRVHESAVINAGSRIQVGAEGPVVVVIWFEVGSEAVAVESAPPIKPPSLASPPPPMPKAAAPVPQAGAMVDTPQHITGSALLEFVNASGRPPVVISKPSVWLGRDPGCDIVFDSGAATVSRKHAEIVTSGGNISIADNQSFNGTLLNGQRISAAVPLYHNDEIQLGLGGPTLRFNAPDRAAPAGASLAGQRSVAAPPPEPAAAVGDHTIAMKLDVPAPGRRSGESAQGQLLMTVAFNGKNELTIGRDPSSDITLDGLQISKRHARLVRSDAGVTIEDTNSTNGVFVNGTRVSRHLITPDSPAQIGSFLIASVGDGRVEVFDTRSKHRIDVIDISAEVKSRGGRIKLLDDISISIQPNEFVGILGPSGAGKSTLIKALSGARPAGTGRVLINGLDLYKQFDSLRRSVGNVPQEDIIHRELSVYRTLYYVAKLRLSRDVTRAEIDRTIDEVLDVTGLSERRDLPVSRLSGGQRKRVSIAVELITKPSVIFLDEPTSGLDPGTEDRIMKLFRQIAESGRTVVMTTHTMENIRMFDKIVLLMRGKLVFYGPPDAALAHFGVTSFKDLFERISAPVEGASASSDNITASGAMEQTAEHWRRQFKASPQFRDLIAGPIEKAAAAAPAPVRGKASRLGMIGAVRQWLTLSRRYFEVLLKDRLNLLILLLQAPAIALLTFFAVGAKQPRDFLYFVIALVAVWFGTSVSAREIVRERPIYRRERSFNLGVLPYLASKFTVLSLIVGLQCVLLFGPLKLLDLVGLLKMPGENYGVPQFTAMLLTAAVGIALGLLVSSMVRTSEMATSLVPLILIPQILFSGLVQMPTGASRVIGLAMPSAWSFDTIKRFSTLDTLEPEGADPRGETRGLGLYRFIEAENEKTVERTKRDLESLRQMNSRPYLGSSALQGNENTPEMRSIKTIPDDLSDYVTFLNPWMDEVLNQAVLVLMFWILAFATLIVLRLQDLVR